MLSEKDKATAINNMHKKIGQVRPCGFWVMRADRQTKRRTDIILITILRIPPGSEALLRRE